MIAFLLCRPTFVAFYKAYLYPIIVWTIIGESERA